MTAMLRRALWLAASGLLLLLLWQMAAARLEPLLLPGPGPTLKALALLAREPGFARTLGLSAWRALGAFLVAALAGTAAGIGAARVPVLERLLQPWMVALLGMPPVAWMVLALLWFGQGQVMPMVTVAVTLGPALFLAALAGERAQDPRLLQMARSFGASRGRILMQVRLPGMLSVLRPALVAGLGTAWKALVMVELLASAEGVGFQLGEARAALDVARALGWVLVTVAMVGLSQGALWLGLRAWRTERQDG